MSIGGVLRTSSIKKPVVITGAFVALFVVTRLLPNQSGAAGSPSGVLLMGLVMGLIASLTTLGIVLIYRTSRIVNFAQLALGAVGAMFTASLVTILNWPFIVAFPIGIIVSGAVGIVAELILRRFFDAPRLVLTIATVGISGIALMFAQQLPLLPFWGNALSATDRATPTIRLMPDCCFEVTSIPFGIPHLLALVLTPVLLFALAFFLQRTKTGAAVRAASENTERAEMLGINVRMLSMIVWSMAGALAGVAVTLQGTTSSFAIQGIAGTLHMLLPLAAAVLAGMRSLPTAIAAAVGLAVLRQALGWSYPEQFEAILALAFLLIIVTGPLLMKRLRAREREASSWTANEEARAVPRELSSVPEVRTWRRGLIGAGVAFVLLFPWVTTTGPTNLAGIAAIVGIVLLSLIVLSGWTGQMSLGQWGLVAVGALVAGSLTSKLSFPFWIAMPLAAMATALVAGVLGLPALRIRGLMLAVSTFAFAFFAWQVLFNEQWFGWLIPQSVERPTLLLLDFEDERSMYYLTVFALAACFFGVSLLRRGRPGRVLLALRESEDELTSMGINPVVTRLSAFMLSGFLAGIAGALFAVHQRAVTQTSFAPEESLNMFLFAVIGGLGSPMGAILGAGVRALQQIVPEDPLLSFFTEPSFGVLAILYIAPGGLAGLVQSVRDSVLRIVAQRRGIAAPSLFADADMDAIERRLVLLSPPMDHRGLATLPAGRRYRLGSEVHATNGRRTERAPDERQALSAAAEALFERATVATAVEERGDQTMADGNGNGRYPHAEE